MTNLKYLISLLLLILIIYSQSVHSLIHSHSTNLYQYSISVNESVQQNTTACSSICLICNNNANPPACSQCMPGYVILTTGLCASCPPGCLLCIGTQTCTQCMNGYTPISESYISRCIKCSQGCQQCNFLQISGGLTIQTTTCLSCFPGFYLLNQTTTISLCNPCIPACTLCFNNQSCLKCAVGYGYNQNQNLCYVCQQNCLQCQPTSGCQVCLVGYYLQQTNNACQPCKQNCLQCVDNQICQKCTAGYYPVISYNQTTNITTYQCLLCPNQCQVCYNALICLTCAKGYFLNITQQNQYNITTNQTVPVIVSAQCSVCPTNCFLCVYPGLCQTCQPGYYLAQSNQCESCGKACYQCSNTGICQLCAGSYYLSNGQCSPCNNLCSICIASQTNQSTCLNCTSFQYAPMNGQCVLCSELTQGCVTCTSAYNCLSCSDGYILQANGICFLENVGFGVVYIVMIVIACIIAAIAIIFAVYACWRYKNGYKMGGDETTNIPGIRASYYQIP